MEHIHNFPSPLKGLWSVQKYIVHFNMVVLFQSWESTVNRSWCRIKLEICWHFCLPCLVRELWGSISTDAAFSVSCLKIPPNSSSVDVRQPLQNSIYNFLRCCQSLCLSLAMHQKELQLPEDWTGDSSHKKNSNLMLLRRIIAPLTDMYGGSCWVVSFSCW